MHRAMLLIMMAAFLLTAPTTTAQVVAEEVPDDALEGLVRPSRQVVLVAPVAGMLAEVSVEESQRVEAGQQLARMDDQMQAIVHQSAKLSAESTSEITRASLVLEEADLTLTRVKQALSKHAATEWETRRAELQREQAAVRLVQAEEQYELAKINVELEKQRLDRYRILAPFDGTVVKIETEAGANMSSSDPVLMIASLHPLEAHLHLPMGIAVTLEPGASYRLQAKAPVDHELTATLRSVSPIIDTASETVRCVFEIDNADHALFAGFKVSFLGPYDPPAEVAEQENQEDASSKEGTTAAR